MRVFRRSGPYLLEEAGTLLYPKNIVVYRAFVPAYLLLAWSMKPYSDNTASARRRFSYMLSSCRMVVECVFGRLKAR